jgi:outer membrane protein assembly factor BamB
MSIEFNDSWYMFRGNTRRTGSIGTKPVIKPSLYWTIKLGPMVSSPVYEDGFLYILTLTGRVFCLDTTKRKIKWHQNIGIPMVSSPLILDNMIICATFGNWIHGDILQDNIIFALDKHDGRMIWEHHVKGDFFSSPCAIGKNMVLGSIDNNLYCINPTGEIIWRYETNDQIWSSPSCHNDIIYFGSDDGFIYSVDSDGSLNWKSKLNGKIRSSSPCLFGDLIFIGTYNGGMYCINRLNGATNWYKIIEKPVLSSPLLVKNRIIFGTSDHRLYCFDMTGSKLWEFETGGKIWASPVCSEHDKLLFIGGLDSHIYGINFYSGKQQWKFPTMGSIDSSPCVADAMLFVGSRDGILYSFEKYVEPSYIS